MSPYLLAGPAVALIGIVAILFVMRHKSTEQRSMYSSRRSQIQHKVQAARQRTLAPHGRSHKAPTEAEIATPMTPAAPVYQAPVAPRQAWEVGPSTSAPAYAPPPAPPSAPAGYTPPAYTPPPSPPAGPPASTYTPAPAAPVEEPSWTPAPAEPSWTPTPASSPPAPAAERSSAPQPAVTPSGGGASWSIVGEGKDAAAHEPAAKGKDKDKRKDKKAAAAAAGSPWQLASGDAPAEEGAAEEVRGPNVAMQLAQYAVLVVGLVMVLIGVLVMVANSKVT
jgi:hypothetical protein